MEGAPESDDYIGLPRPQSGSEPQITLLTLLANYWLHSPVWLPSAALVDLLVEFDMSTASARTALSRLSRRGVLVSRKEGRHTFYLLSDRANGVLRQRTVELLRFGRDDDWDGLWTCVAFSIPNERRHLRAPLRADLRALGFAGMYDGLWISPRPPGEALARALAELAEVGSATVLRAEISSSDRPHPIDAFDHEAVRVAYDEFLARFGPVRSALASGEVTLRTALVERTRLFNDWRLLNRLDPELPSALLPDDWPRPDARELFVEIHDGLTTPAAARFEQVVTAHDPSLLGRHRWFTTESPPNDESAGEHLESPPPTKR